MADLEERIRMFLKLEQEQRDYIDDSSADTFAERAEWFFKKRPQLLALLQDLYNGYVSLLARCSKIEGNKHKRHSSLFSASLTAFDHPDTEDLESSDAESSLSYQQTPRNHSDRVDEIVAQLVMKSVEADVLQNQAADMETQCNESSRKIELLKKLMEVLESERVVLLNENARLGYRVAELIEENKGLSSETMFLKKKAAQLARCVLHMKEDHRVCLLTRKIEDLEAQIYGLEKRNNDYYHQMLLKDKPKKEQSPSPSPSPSRSRRSKMKNVGLMGCFQIERVKFKNRNEDEMKKKVPNWWEKVKKTLITTPISSSDSSFSPST